MCGFRPNVRQIFLGLQSRDDDLLDLFVRDRARRPNAGLIVKPVEPTLDKPPTPEANGLHRRPATGCDICVRRAPRAGQNDAGAKREASAA